MMCGQVYKFSSLNNDFCKWLQSGKEIVTVYKLPFLSRNKERKEKGSNATKDSFQSSPWDLKRLLKEWQQRTLIKMFMSFNLESNVKVTRWGFSETIPPKFEHKLRRH